MPYIIKLIIDFSPILATFSLIYAIFISFTHFLPITLSASIYPKLKSDYLKIEKITYLSWTIIFISLAFFKQYIHIDKPDIVSQVIVYLHILLIILIYIYRVFSRIKLNKLGEKLRLEEKRSKK